MNLLIQRGGVLHRAGQVDLEAVQRQGFQGDAAIGFARRTDPGQVDHQPRLGARRDFLPQRADGTGTAMIFHRCQRHRPDRQRRGQRKTAGHALARIDETRIHVIARRKADALGDIGVINRNAGLNQHHAGGGGQCVGKDLIQQLLREAAEFFLHFQLHAGGQKGAAFQEAGNGRVQITLDQPAQPFGKAGIFLGKFARLLFQQGKFAVVMFPKGPFHVLTRNFDIRSLPAPRSTSASKSSRKSMGSPIISAEMAISNLWLALFS